MTILLAPSIPMRKISVTRRGTPWSLTLAPTFHFLGTASLCPEEYTALLSEAEEKKRSCEWLRSFLCLSETTVRLVVCYSVYHLHSFIAKTFW